MRARLSNLVRKLLYYVLILSAILFAMYLYSDDYDVFPWATKDEGLKFFQSRSGLDLLYFYFC